MKLNMYYLVTGAIIASTTLFAGCKSGIAVAPPANPPVSVVTEVPKMPIPTDAKELLKQASENSLNAKSVSSKVLMNVEMLGAKMPVTIDVVRYDTVVNINNEFGGMRSDIYSNGKASVMMEPMTKRWKRVPQEQNNMLLLLLELIQHKRYGEYLKDISFGPEEKIQDKSYYVVEATLKPEASNKILTNPMIGNLDIKFDKALLTTWVEKDTCLIYKSIINMEASMTGDIPGMPGKDIEDEDTEPKTPSAKPAEPAKAPEALKTTKIKYEIEINDSDYNKVEPIVIPPEAKALLETPVESQPEPK